jgi:hypothetical protein
MRTVVLYVHHVPDDITAEELADEVQERLDPLGYFLVSQYPPKERRR